MSGAETTSSVAPTVQWAGYTGTAYATTSLYAVGDGAERTSDVGGKDVNEQSVLVCWTPSCDRSYNDRWNACDKVMRSG
jgi:hypothetical protein